MQTATEEEVLKREKRNHDCNKRRFRWYAASTTVCENLNDTRRPLRANIEACRNIAPRWNAQRTPSFVRQCEKVQLVISWATALHAQAQPYTRLRHRPAYLSALCSNARRYAQLETRARFRKEGCCELRTVEGHGYSHVEGSWVLPLILFRMPSLFVDMISNIRWHGRKMFRRVERKTLRR